MVALLPTVLWANAYAATTQDSLRTMVYFPVGYSQLDLSYKGNADKLKALTEGIRAMQGNPDINYNLSEFFLRHRLTEIQNSIKEWRKEEVSTCAII